MKKQKKTEQINLRVTREEKERIKYLSKKSDNISLSEYIISRSLNLGNENNSSFKKVNTLTINPWIYCKVEIDKLDNVINYDTSKLVFDIKGPGLNVAKITKLFNIPTLAMHYSGGFTGKYLINNLAEENIDQIHFDSTFPSKINLEIKYEKNKKMIFNGTQIRISPKIRQEIVRKIRSIHSGEILLLSGDFHKDDQDFIYEIAKIANSNNIKLIFDLNESFSESLLKFKPIILKLRYVDLKNHYSNLELDNNLENDKNCDNIKKSLLKFQNKGAQNILVTFGKKGSVLLDAQSDFLTANLDFEFKDSYQGAGDAFIGAYISNYLINSYEAFLYANAAGLASVSKHNLPTIEEINQMKKSIKIKKH